MTYSTQRQRNIKRYLRAVDAIAALLILSRSYNSERRALHETLRAEAEILTRRQMEERLPALEYDLQTLCNLLGPTQSLEYYVDFIQGAPIADDQFLFLPKWRLKQLFRNIEQVLGRLEKLPEHTLLSLDFHGISRPEDPGELRILEAALFEDMCATFNLAWELTPLAADRRASRVILKEAAAMRRASVSAAFYMVEAYLNSIAFDHLVANSNSRASPELDKIAEWDSAKGRERLVSFRDKLLGYPKIIMGLTHPPLQENNCPEMKFLMEVSKLYRDAIVHANPRPEAFTYQPKKELNFWRIGSATPITSAGPGGATDFGIASNSEWVGTIDAAIKVVRKIEDLVHPGGARLFWLQDRTPEGPFSLTVFD